MRSTPSDPTAMTPRNSILWRRKVRSSSCAGCAGRHIHLADANECPEENASSLQAFNSSYRKKINTKVRAKSLTEFAACVSSTVSTRIEPSNGNQASCRDRDDADILHPPRPRKFLRKMKQFSQRRRMLREAARFESLEPRLYLAADLGLQPDGWPQYQPATAASDYFQAASLTTTAEGEGAEGEEANIPTLADFAQALTMRACGSSAPPGAPFCMRQKEMFGSAAGLLPYIETTYEVASARIRRTIRLAGPSKACPRGSSRICNASRACSPCSRSPRTAAFPCPPI